MDESKIDVLKDKVKSAYSGLVNNLNELAVAYNTEKQFGPAMETLEKALQLDPNNHITYHNLGLILAGKNETEKALGYYKKALEINPTGAPTLNNMGYLYECISKSGLAIDCYKKAIASSPGYLNAYINLINAYCRINDKEHALEELKKLKNINMNPAYYYEIEKKIFDEELKYILIKEQLENQALENKEYPHIKIGIVYFSENAHDKNTYQNFITALNNQLFKNFEVFPVSNEDLDFINNKNFNLQEIINKNCTHICFVEQGDLISNNSLLSLAQEIDKNPDLELIYSDEDLISQDGKTVIPYFKTEYAEFILFSHNYMNALLCLKLTDNIIEELHTDKISQDFLYKLVLKLTRSPINIHRIPKVLYHRNYENQDNIEENETRDTVTNELSARNYKAKVLQNKGNFNIVKFYKTGEPKISIIIPFKDRIDLLKGCIESIETRSTYSNYEIILVNNRSTDHESLRYFNSSKYKRVNADFDFNFSKINNLAVESAEGEYLILLNNDTEIISPDWMESLLGLAQLDQVGLVGAKLLYRQGLIQHAGMIKYGNGRILHANRYMDSSTGGYKNYNNIIREYLTVTGACVMISKDKFHRIEGFDENLTVHFNDVDLGYKCIKAGLVNLYNPHCVLYHLESISTKGLFTETITENHQYYYEKWKDIITENDPYYNPNLSDYRVDFSLRIF